MTAHPSTKPTRRAVRVTERDLDILEMAASFRFLSINQAAVLHFGSESSAATRLRALERSRLLTSVFMPVRPMSRTTTTVYALSAAGARTVAPRFDGLAPRSLSEREHRSGLFLDHTLRRNDLRVCLERMSREGREVQLLAWRQTPEEVRSSAVVTVRRQDVRVPAVPDAFFVLRHRGAVHSFLVEIDMGTVSKRVMALRYRAYWELWKSGLLRARFGNAPIRVLTLTVTPRHLETLRRLGRDAPGNGQHGSQLFWFGLLSLADVHAPEKLLAAAWQVSTARPTPARSLLPSSTHL